MIGYTDSVPRLKSPFSEEVYAEWIGIAFGPEGESTASAAERAQSLFDRCFLDGRWRTDISDAELLAILLEGKRCMNREFEAGAAALESFRAHPDYEAADPPSISHALARMISIKLVLGRDQEAMPYFHEGQRLGDQRCFKVLVRNALLAALDDQDPNWKVSEEWLEMARWMRARMRKPIISARSLRGQTYGEVRKIIGRTA